MKIAAMAFATLLAAVAHADVHVTFDQPERVLDVDLAGEPRYGAPSSFDDTRRG
jgi:hypothetical protein